MRLPNSAHESHPWVIAEIAHDFRLLDVWAVPVQGHAGDFDSFVEVMTSLDPDDAGLPSRVLFWVRLRLGDLFGWDDRTKEHAIPGATETTLSARLPEDLRGSAESAVVGDALQRVGAAFVPLYRTDEEWAAEISNDTVHAVLHLAWVEQEKERYRGQLAIYVKPRGRLGDAYMKLIEPFRHLIVYPALMRQIERAWDARASQRI